MIESIVYKDTWYLSVDEVIKQAYAIVLYTIRIVGTPGFHSHMVSSSDRFWLGTDDRIIQVFANDKWCSHHP